MDDRVQILGLCRFSVPSLGGFQTEHDSLEARRAALYHPARLEARLAWFETVMLPAIAAQDDRDFTLVLLVGEDLPEPWRGRLLALVAGIPEIVVEWAAPGPHREICAAAMRAHVEPGARVLAQFRLDDDDAVARGFTARLRADLPPVLGLLDRRKGFAVDYGKGIVLRWKNRMLSAEARHARQWTPGLVYVNRPEEDRFILDTQHHQMWRYMPVISWTDELMWVRGAHDGNDSAVPRAGADRIAMTEERLHRLLDRRFGIDIAALGRRLLDIPEDGR